jgi:hypothetical protein
MKIHRNPLCHTVLRLPPPEMRFNGSWLRKWGRVCGDVASAVWVTCGHSSFGVAGQPFETTNIQLLLHPNSDPNILESASPEIYPISQTVYSVCVYIYNTYIYNII